MTGEFLGVHPDKKPHTCVLPTWCAEFTVWRCECGKAYRYEYGGAQYNESFYVWKRFIEMDGKPLPEGQNNG